MKSPIFTAQEREIMAAYPDTFFASYRRLELTKAKFCREVLHLFTKSKRKP